VQLHFMQPVLYCSNNLFPDSKERLAHWITPAEHCGDALSYVIRDAETGELLVCSIMRAINKNHPNFRSTKDSMSQQQPKDQGEDSGHVSSGSGPRIESSSTPAVINHEDLMGASYLNCNNKECNDKECNVLSNDSENSNFRASIMSPTTKEFCVEEISAEAIKDAIEMLKLKVSEDVYSFNSITKHRKNPKGNGRWNYCGQTDQARGNLCQMLL